MKAQRQIGLSPEKTKELLTQLRDGLRRARLEIDRIDAAVGALLIGDEAQLAANHFRTTPAGNITNLSGKIKEYLGLANTPKTSQEIAEAIYRVESGVTYDLFKRRVIVTISALAKRGDGICPAFAIGPGKEKQWTLCAQKHEDRPKAVLHGGRGNEGEGISAQPSSIPELS